MLSRKIQGLSLQLKTIFPGFHHLLRTKMRKNSSLPCCGHWQHKVEAAFMGVDHMKTIRYKPLNVWPAS